MNDNLKLQGPIYEDIEERYINEIELDKKELEERYRILMTLPKTIMSTKSNVNFVFKLELKFISQDYVSIRYNSDIHKLINLRLNLGRDKFKVKIYELLEWLDSSNFKVLSGSPLEEKLNSEIEI